MEQAWRQVGEVLAANRLRRRAEYSLAATSRLYSRWIKKLDTGDLVTSTAPVHAKVLAAPGTTIVGRLRDSPLPPAVVSVELRRFARERGVLSHAAQWQQSAGVEAVTQRSAEAEPLVQRVPLDSIEALDPPSRVWGELRAKEILTRLVTEGDVASLEPAEAATRLDAVSVASGVDIPTAEVVARHVAASQVDLEQTLTSIGLLPQRAVMDAARRGPEPPPTPPSPPDRGRGRDPFGPFRPGRERLEREGRHAVDLTPTLLPVEVLDTVTEHPDLVSRVGDSVVLDTVVLDTSSRTGRTATSIDAAVFDQLVDGTYRPERPPRVSFDLPGDRLAEIGAELGAVVVGIADLVIRPADVAPRPGSPLTGGLGSLRHPLLAALDPRRSIPRAVNSRIEAMGERDEEALDDIMAAPDLSEPTYQRLAAISHDWLLPGIDKLPADTTTLVAANREFIASFLVGMNHELARELLWREYPTDQRGTYARQFWTHRASPAREDQLDLKQELHRAGASSLPGLTIKAPSTAEPGDPLVLVVKGELVQRYPGLIITASTTTTDESGDRVPSGSPTQPDFVGLLPPDVLLVGFTELTEQKVRDAEREHADKRWWFFFAEHFTEPRFGLDEPNGTTPDVPGSWNDAAWQHVTVADGVLTPRSTTLELRKGLDLTSGPLLRWGSSAAAQAWITLQFPFRRGMPASILLPPEGTP